MKRIIFLWALLSATLNAQNFQISGKVLENESNTPLEYATIVLENLNNSNDITGGITNEKGEFNIKAKKGIYLLKIQFFSFKTYEVKHFELNEDKKLGTILLHSDIEVLSGVEVIAERSSVELHLDKKIYNVGQDMTLKGGSVSDVLDNVPSVSVSAEGKVSFRGNENVQILINGKPSALSGMNDEALRQIPAESIEKVEVISNPSSRYEAEGAAGIINIILKKGSALGFMGSVSASVGHPEAYEAATNLSLRKQDWTFFGGISVQRRNFPSETKHYQQYFNNSAQTTGFQDELRLTNRFRQGINANAGVEYRFNDKTTLSNSFVYNQNDGENNSDTDFYNFDALRAFKTHRFRKNTESDDSHRFQYAFNFEHKFDQQGHKLTADYQFSASQQKKNGLINEKNLTTLTHLETEKTTSNEPSKQHLTQIDYVLPFGKNHKSQFEAGYRGTIDEIDIDYLNGTLDNSGNLLINNNFSNRFMYDQYVNALYAQLGTKLGRWNFMSGLRLEHTQIKSLLINTNENYSKRYTDLFPSVYLGYELSDSQQISLSYSRRLRRPRSREMNPFLGRSSNTNIFSGNPDLNPTYTNAFEAGYLLKIGKISLNTSVYYNHTTQAFEMISIESGDFVMVDGLSVPVMLKRPINLSDEDRIGTEFTANYTPKRNWRFSLNFNLFHFKSEGKYTYTNYLGNSTTQHFSTQSNSWTSRFSAKLPLFYDIDFQTNIMYIAPRKNSQSHIKEILSANLALSKDILNGKGNIALNVSDLFDSRKMVADTRTERVLSHTQMQWRKRQAMLSFTYRFGNLKPNNQERNKKQNSNGGGSPDMEFEG